MLALSCAVLLFSLIATVFTGLTLGLCCGAKASLSQPSNVNNKCCN